jgi:hypothetical protein
MPDQRSVECQDKTVASIMSPIPMLTVRPNLRLGITLLTLTVSSRTETQK